MVKLLSIYPSNFWLLSDLSQFSKRFGHLDDGNDICNIAEALAERFDYVSHVGIYPSLHRVFWKLISAMTFITKQVDYTYVFAQKQIDSHQEHNSDKFLATPDMLDRFLEFHNKDPNYFTKNDVLIGAYTSIVAGADTTWVSLGSIIYYLHKPPRMSSAHSGGWRPARSN